MKVLLDCRMASWSGVGRYTVGLTRALAARADVELVQVCTEGDSPPTREGPRIQTITSTQHPLGLKGALELGHIQRRSAPDLVHCLHFPTPVPAQAPLVVTLQDLIPLVFPASMPATTRRAGYRLWNWRATRSAKRVIVPSRTTEGDVARLFPAARGKMVVIPHAADDFSSGQAAQLSGRLAALAASSYLLAMGSTRPHKGLDELLSAFGTLAPSFPELRLLLVGTEPPGFLDSQYEDAPPDTRRRVTFTGDVIDEDLRALYTGASVFVVSSRYEGFGLPVLEAMALGTPVVCSDAASLPEVAGEAALTYPTDEHAKLATSVTRVLRDARLRRRLVKAGHDRAAQFSWAKAAEATAAVYASVLEDEGSSQDRNSK